MRTALIWNLKFHSPRDYGDFKADIYNFECIKIPKNERNEIRQQVITYRVSFSKPQENSVMRKGALVLPLWMKGLKLTQDELRPYGRYKKFIEDVLQLIELLSGCNVILNTYRYAPHFPLRAKKSVHPICDTSRFLELQLPIGIKMLKNEDWLKKYHMGFHIIHFNNAANIATTEPRFLSYSVLWEMLYAFENNGTESTDLNEIITFLLRQYFGSNLAFSGVNPCIFHLLRNQLAHSGLLPLTGKRLKFAKEEFKTLSIDDCYDYVKFFEQLTYVLTLLTLGINKEFIFNRLRDQNFEDNLKTFLKDGTIPHFHLKHTIMPITKRP